MEFNEELKKQAKEIFSLYAKHSPSGYAITEEDFIWTLAEYDSRQSKVSRVELPVSDDCERLYISEIDYFVDGQKKYYHIKVINRTDKFIEFEWVWSGAKQLMPLKRFNAIYKIEEELASNSR